MLNVTFANTVMVNNFFFENKRFAVNRMVHWPRKFFQGSNKKCTDRKKAIVRASIIKMCIERRKGNARCCDR